MRDALSLTDQAIAYAAGQVTLDAVQSMLGALDQSFLIRLLDALAQEDGAGLLAVADEMAARSLSYSAALQDLGSLLHRIALAQTVPAAVPDDLPERADIIRLAALFDAEEIQLFYQIAVHGRNELGLAPDEYAGFSMTLLRMLAFRPAASAGDDGGGQKALSAAAVKPARVAASTPSTPSQTQTQAASVAPNAAASTSGLTSNATKPAAPSPAVNGAPARSGGLSPARAALEAARAGVKNALSASRPSAATSSSSASSPASLSKPATAASAVAASESAPASTSASDPAPSLSSRPISSAVPPVSSEEIDLPPAPPWDDEASFDSSNVQQDLTRMPVQKKTESPIAASAAATAANGRHAQNAREHAAPANGQAVAGLQPEQPEQRAFQLHPLAELQWDGNWPQLAVSLPMRGVAQQLAQQSELLKCGRDQGSDAIQFDLQVAVETLLAAGSVDKLSAALAEHFGQAVRVNASLGAVQHSAHTFALADMAARQQQAEQSMQDDPFVQKLMREFGATIVKGSIRPL
jgi:DNA polymerase-3 subunit gamma/tau